MREVFGDADRQADLITPGALERRLQESLRASFFVGLAGGDPVRVAEVRQMRWYDAIDARIYQLNQIRT